MEYGLDLAREFIINHGSLAVFLMGILEEIFFPIPSSLVFLAAGFFMVAPGTSLEAAFLLILIHIAFWGSLGVAIGSFLIYGLFYWGGKLFLQKYGKYFGVSWEEVEKIEGRFAQRNADGWLIFLLRALPICSITVVSVVAGAMRIPWRKFGFATLTGAFVRLVILGFAGWQMGEAYELIGDQLLYWEKWGTVALLVVAVIGFWWWRRVSSRAKQSEVEGSRNH
ncbi:MAG: VTT domain-containing protein [Patescibacteria group bacterium]